MNLYRKCHKENINGKTWEIQDNESKGLIFIIYRMLLYIFKHSF